VSAVAGAVTVRIWPGVIVTAEAAVKVAVVAAAAKLIVPTLVPFTATVKVAAAVGAVPALKELPVKEAGRVTFLAITYLAITCEAVTGPANPTAMS
jgi:hypothetical protein